MIIYFLPIIIILGLVTSYQDITKRKIKNKYVIIALICSILINSTLFILNLIQLDYIIFFLINIVGATLLGFIGWHFSFWGAGDAKLYLAFFSLIPLTHYKFISIDLPILELIINAFIPLFIYLTVKLILKTNFAHKRKILKRFTNHRYVLRIILTVFSLTWISKSILNYVGINSNYLYIMMGLFLISYLFNKIFEEQTIYVLIFIAIIRLFISPEHFTRFEFWFNFLSFLTGFLLIKVLIINSTDFYSYKIKISNLKEGMIPLELITKKGFAIFEKNQKFLELNKDTIAIERRTTGLTKKDIKFIQTAHNSRKLHFSHLNIQETIPFAPFIFAGCLLTIIFKGNIITALIQIFA
ncbi:hypothetical protein HN587_06435 [Candidatus Woesearchaeota archaeon]|jgi:hypothetical protein|nr:hypothetical protein [Candidatus Woesearchaeota archaeon]